MISEIDSNRERYAHLFAQNLRDKVIARIEIETAEEYQRRGYGALVGARLTLYRLERGIKAIWVSANAESSSLAEKLGYQRVSAYETLAIGA